MEDDAARQFIGKVCAKNRSFYSTDLGQGALKDLQQTFPHHWLYVGELLQNAVDAGAKKIRLIVEPESVLVFEHDGAAFEEHHVRGLCSRGLSTKGAGNVGFMGIGFKAVFQSYECVDVSSGPWRFRLCVNEEVGEYDDRQRDWLGCVSPTFVDTISEPSPGMQCRFVLHKRLVRLGSINEDIAHVLAPDLLVLALLARRGVEAVEWNDQRWVLSESESILDEERTRVVLDALDESTGEIKQWILFSATYQPSKAAIGRFLEHRQIRPTPAEKEKVLGEARRKRTVEVFCPLDDAGTPLPPKRGQAHALLPTGETVPLGLHVQADWLLNTSRRELMEVETNAWHQEILARLPSLLRAYLQWLTQLPAMPDKRLAECYAVLPAWDETDGAFGAYLSNPSFRDGLAAALADLPFLPVRRDEGVAFVTPGDAVLLPTALRAFDATLLRPWELFGGDVTSTTLLGNAALASLDNLQLLRPLTPNDLRLRWDNGAVGRWRGSLGDHAADAHHRLLSALAALDGEGAWQSAPLRVLPSASGEWIDRRSASGLPLDWDSVPEQDPPLRSWLEPLLGPSVLRVEWTFDRALQRDTNARQYIANLSRTKTEDLLSKWWSALPSKPDEETCVLVLDATAWVRNKRKQQANLVTRVLCDGPSGMILVPLADAVLAEPYASGARRRFFRENPCVSGRYLQHESGASDAEWRSFFETASKGLKGPFRFVENSEVVTRAALRQRLPEFDPPTTKSVPITKRHNDVLFSSNDYLLTDPALPNTLGGIINSSVSAADAEAIGLWLWEARQELTNKAVIRVHYVPYSSSDLYSQRAGTARWVGILQTARWLYGTDGTGPYAPAELLARPDPARPEAPVVRLAEDLATALETCGITFGTSVPEIPALERLRREGPVADTERALQLLTQAFEASQDNAEYRAELVSVLSTCALIGVPIGARPIDNAWRISAERLVKRKVRGADLGRWLVSIDTLTSGLADEDTFKQLIHLISSVCDIPDAPTWGQALAFLSWVWQSRPEAELVSSTLPRAYRLVAEELETDPACEDAWNDAKSRAIAYVASRKWVSVESEQLYLDDLGDDRLRGLVDGILFATPGHFGETPQEQHRIATLLGVRFLSDRFQVTLQATGERTLPAHWPRALDAILELLQTYAREEQADDFVQRTPLVISHFLQLRKVLIDQGVETKNWTVHAARREEGICVTGDPDDFAADLCRVLLQWTGLATRKDLDEVAPTITQLIGWLDKPDKFKRRLQVLTPQQGDTAPVSTPPTQPAPEDTPAPKREPGPPIPSSEEPPANDEPAEPGTPTDDDGDEEPPLSGGYTPENREGRLRSVQRKIDQLNKEKAALLGVGPIPDEKPEPTEGDEHPGTFASDVQYREAVVEYETLAGRYAETKDAKQPGYDIDSFDRPLDDPERLLIRRIEVKGHGCPWEDDDIVALSDRQFIEAFNKNANGTPTGEDFDYWLYVVERLETGLHVLPIRNPSRRAAKFEFRAGTWRSQAQQSNEDKNEDSVRL